MPESCLKKSRSVVSVLEFVAQESAPSQENIFACAQSSKIENNCGSENALRLFP